MNISAQGLRRQLLRWGAVVILAATTFVLGWCGFAQYYDGAEKPRDALDLTYLTLQLFTLESGGVEPPIPMTLQVARYLAIIASAYAIVLTVLSLFSVQLQRASIWLLGGHVVICGLGRKGVRLVQQLRHNQTRVVVVESDEHNPQLDHCRDMGCYVICGSSDDEWTLRGAHLSRAKALIALAGDDGVNIETAVRAHSLAQTRIAEHLQCVIHISDPHLQATLKRHDIYAAHDDPFDLEFFNTYEMAARQMVRATGAADPTRLAQDGSVQILIVGLGHFGEALLTRILKDWHIEPPPETSKLEITVFDLDAHQRRRHYEQAHPNLLHLAAINYVQCDIHEPQLSEASYWQSQPATSRLDAVFVCIDDDASAAFAALTLRNGVPDAPILVRMSQESGVATLLGNTTQEGVIPNVTAIGLVDIACSLDLVLGGTQEVLAQAVHQGYVIDQLAAGATAEANPSLAPWHRLSAELKESNRKQASDIRNKLASIGCEVVPKPYGLIGMIELTAEEVESLARLEHERWLAERGAAGWRYGPRKDADAKTNPSVVPWDELAPEAKDHNRAAARRIPQVLAKADFEIRRMQ